MICEDIYLMREQLIDEYEKALAEDDTYKARCILEELQEMELERGCTKLMPCVVKRSILLQITPFTVLSFKVLIEKSLTLTLSRGRGNSKAKRIYKFVYLIHLNSPLYWRGVGGEALFPSNMKLECL